jgi:hypothetical protein
MHLAAKISPYKSVLYPAMTLKERYRGFYSYIST